MMSRPSVAELTDQESGESSALIADRVANAREVALARQGCLNADIPVEVLDDVAPLSEGAKDCLHDALSRAALSGRGYHRVRRVARTVADLHGASATVDISHVEAALQMRHNVLSKTVAV
jgi:magnesium chelatase family protein